ncbi:hypothetical protein AAY473_006125 [Plecturocebus cupreus]
MQLEGMGPSICKRGQPSLHVQVLLAPSSFHPVPDPPSVPGMPTPSNAVVTGFYYAGQAGLKLLTSGDMPASASQSAEIIGMSHCTQPINVHTYSLSWLPRLDYNGAISAHYNLHLPDGVSLCCLGQSAVAQSWLTATSASRVQRWGYSMWSRLVSNSWPQEIHPSWPSQSAGITGPSENEGAEQHKASRDLRTMKPGNSPQGSQMQSPCSGPHGPAVLGKACAVLGRPAVTG